MDNTGPLISSQELNEQLIKVALYSSPKKNSKQAKFSRKRQKLHDYNITQLILNTENMPLYFYQKIVLITLSCNP